MPLAMVLVAPTAWLVGVVSAASLLFLAFLGAICAKAGGANVMKATLASHLLGRLCDGADRGHWSTGRHGRLSEGATRSDAHQHIDAGANGDAQRVEDDMGQREGSGEPSRGDAGR
ncbi:hypothetical protein FHS85_003167 [Rhodoligotrophos appendicifer]